MRRPDAHARIRTLAPSLAMWLLVTLAALAASGFAQTDMAPGGVLVNRTKTLAGNEFFRRFSECWVPPDNIKTYTIVVLEQADERWGGSLLISVDGEIVYRNFVGVRPLNMADLAREASAQVNAYLARRDFIDRSLDKEDLGGDEL